MVVRTLLSFVKMGAGGAGNGLEALLCRLKPWDQLSGPGERQGPYR